MSAFESGFTAGALLGELARNVGCALDYSYNEQDEINMLSYLKAVKDEWEQAVQ